MDFEKLLVTVKKNDKGFGGLILREEQPEINNTLTMYKVNDRLYLDLSDLKICI
jgi:hypothetical protein